MFGLKKKIEKYKKRLAALKSMHPGRGETFDPRVDELIRVLSDVLEELS